MERGMRFLIILVSVLPKCDVKDKHVSAKDKEN